MTGSPVDPNILLLRAEELLQQRSLSAAYEAFTLAAKCGADADRCSGGLWMTHMLAGELELAWQQSDALRARSAHDPHRFWNGETIDNKRLMLRCLHGFGDAVQMLRYLPLLRQRCSAVTVEVPPRLLALAPCFDGMGEVITWGEDAPAVPAEWDAQAEIMELPYLFRTALSDLPIAECYLKLPRTVQQEVAVRMGPKKCPRVGVVWSTGEWNLSRAIPFALIQQLTQHTSLEWWNLQGERQHDDWHALPGSEHLRDAAEVGDGIATLAAVIAHMDLVITADTLAAHLAGAMGKPAWVLLQHAADWRWMHTTSHSPWYPSLRLFRQTQRDDWQSVMQDVTAALAQWTKERR